MVEWLGRQTWNKEVPGVVSRWPCGYTSSALFVNSQLGFLTMLCSIGNISLLLPVLFHYPC